MGLLSKLFGGQGTDDFSNSEEYKKIVEYYGKEKADEIMRYWIQAYLCFAAAAAVTDDTNMDQLHQLSALIRRELIDAKGIEFAMSVDYVTKLCDEGKLAEEIDAVERYKKNSKYHWMKHLNVTF